MERSDGQAPDKSRARRRRTMLLAGAAAACLAVTAIGAGAAGQASASPGTARYAHAWLNPHQNPDNRARELLARMTLAQKFQMVDGTGFAFNAGYAGHIQGIPALGIPDLYLADGAMGVGNGSTGVTLFPDGDQQRGHLGPGHGLHPGQRGRH